MLLLILLQAASPALPDIELRIQARAKSVTIEQKGETRLEVHADPDGGSRVDTVSLPPKAEGRTTLRNISVDIRGHANIADPTQMTSAPETQPQN
jgi:hypothetical protein